MKKFSFRFLVGAASVGSSVALVSTTLLSPQTTQTTVAAPNSVAASAKIIYDGENNEAIVDLRQSLQGYDAGIVELEKTELGERTGQEFYLERKGDKTTIKYTTPHSLENAVYTLLNHWGFRWYGPGENWFVKPRAIRAGNIAGKWISPSFRNRDFFGTGGLDFDKNPAFDPENNYKKSWYTWKRRNRFSNDFAVTGHTGEAFYQQNKALLDAHPEWFNGEVGKKAGRIKIEVPAAVAAYKSWAGRNVASSKESFINIGVDPEDGRGGADDPLPPDGFDGIDNWNHADKWWWLANEVAKDFPADNKHIVVSMYAYGDGPTNALAPKFKLRKNVYPTIIPNAFQKAYLPQEMVKVWANSIRGNMGIYDYWNITQWSLGLPQFNLHTMSDKLKFWHSNKIDGILNESTEAAGPMGHAHWLAGQLEFDSSQDFDALYNQYLTDLFGRAASAMKKMYDRWGNNPQGAGEVGLSLADLKAASDLVANDSLEWKRINELKAYVHYMKLYYDHDGTQESKNRLFEYLYSIHHLYMVQTSAFVGQQYIAPFEKGNITPVGTDKRLSAAEIEVLFQTDLKSSPKKYEVVNFQFDFNKVKYTDPTSETNWRFGSNTTAYFVPQQSQVISFDAGNEIGNSDFSVATNEGVLLSSKVGISNFDYKENLTGSTWHMKKFTLKVQAGKKYYARLRGGFNRFKMHSQVVVFNAHNGNDFDNYGYPTHYFYVPKNCDEIIFEDGIAAKPDGTINTGFFFDPAKNDATIQGVSTGIKNLYRVPIKPEWKGKVIACSFAHTDWNLKNLPEVLSLQPFAYNENP